MLLDHINQNFFDGWGEKRFRNWVLEVIRRVYGDSNFIPGPSRGPDAGIDSEYSGQEIPFEHQIKWREIGGKDGSKVRSEILQTFKKELENQNAKGYSMKYLFITNVALTRRLHEQFRNVIRAYPCLDVEYWEFERLCVYLREHDDLILKYSEYFTPEQVKTIKTRHEKIVQRLEQEYAKKISRAEFKKIQYKIKDLFIDKNLQMKFYYGFVYLLRPLYLDERGLQERKILRHLFDINELEEKYFVDSLRESRKITIVGGLISVTDSGEAKSILSELVTSIKISLNEVIDLFVKA